MDKTQKIEDDVRRLRNLEASYRTTKELEIRKDKLNEELDLIIQQIYSLGGGTGPIAEEIMYLPEEIRSQMIIPQDEIKKAANDFFEFKIGD